jgi:hypothetical protein
MYKAISGCKYTGGKDGKSKFVFRLYNLHHVYGFDNELSTMPVPMPIFFPPFEAKNLGSKVIKKELNFL